MTQVSHICIRGFEGLVRVLRNPRKSNSHALPWRCRYRARVSRVFARVYAWKRAAVTYDVHGPGCRRNNIVEMFPVRRKPSLPSRFLLNELKDNNKNPLTNFSKPSPNPRNPRRMIQLCHLSMMRSVAHAAFGQSPAPPGLAGRSLADILPTHAANECDLLRIRYRSGPFGSLSSSRVRSSREDERRAISRRVGGWEDKSFMYICAHAGAGAGACACARSLEISSHSSQNIKARQLSPTSQWFIVGSLFETYSHLPPNPGGWVQQRSRENLSNHLTGYGYGHRQMYWQNTFATDDRRPSHDVRIGSFSLRCTTRVIRTPMLRKPKPRNADLTPLTCTVTEPDTHGCPPVGTPLASYGLPVRGSFNLKESTN